MQGRPQRASNGQVALSALGCGRARLTAFIASVQRTNVWHFHGMMCSSLNPAWAILAGGLGSIGLCLHLGQGSLPCCATRASPTSLRKFGHLRDLRLKIPVGSGTSEISQHTTYNIQGVKHCDPLVFFPGGL